MAEIKQLVMLENPMRAWYIDLDDSGRFAGTRKEDVVGLVVLGSNVYSMRVGSDGRGVLVGAPSDSMRERLLGVTKAGVDVSDVEGADERVRAWINEELEEPDE